MTYKPFRCSECTLMRCTTPNTVCDECMVRICETAYNTPEASSIVNSFNNQPPVTVPFVNFPKGATLCASMTTCICNGPGTLDILHALQDNSEIRLYDGDISMSNSPSTYMAMMASPIHIWHAGRSGYFQAMQLTFQRGLTAQVRSGSFALQFKDYLGNMFKVPY